jgi:DNA polymerase III sliding clamp (beta) subunit (PCNA family)
MTLFKATITEGIYFKKMIEVLHNVFKFVIFHATEDGLFLRMMNTQESLLVDIELPRSKFASFSVRAPVLFSLNVMHLHKVITSLKRRDIIVLEITDSFDMLHVTVQPLDSDYSETVTVSIQNVQMIDIDIPYEYGDPICVPQQKFHKMCKEMNGIGQELIVHGNENFIHFQSSVAGMYGKGVMFGRIGGPITYNDIFQTENFVKISKISSFGQPIFLHAVSENPLYILVDVGSIGKLSIFLKSSSEIMDDNI